MKEFKELSDEHKIYLVFGSIIAVLILIAVAQAIAIASQISLT